MYIQKECFGVQILIAVGLGLVQSAMFFRIARTHSLFISHHNTLFYDLSCVLGLVMGFAELCLIHVLYDLLTKKKR